MSTDEQGITLPLGLFSSLDTEIFPPPAGISPDCQDVIFSPQSVASREGLRKILTVPIAGLPQIVYHKSYIQPNGNPLTLILDATGTLWKEDVKNLPGLATFAGNLFGSPVVGQSVTAFGREFLTSGDGLSGLSVPLQYDGVNLDRVSQDGPGAAPSIGDDSTSVVIPANALDASQFSGISTLTENGNVVTATLGGPIANLQVGDTVNILGAGVAGYNGFWQVTSISGNQFTYIASTRFMANSGPVSVYTNLATVLMSPNVVGVVAGDLVTIAGAGNAAYNGTWSVRAATPFTSFVVAIVAAGTAISGGGTISAAGSIAVGAHQCVVLFQTRNGFVTAPSPQIAWSSAGGKRVLVTNLPIGPLNVIARILAFTGAGGNNFFYVPQTLVLPSTTGGPPTVVRSTVVADNTSTTATIDFSDNALFAATAIDIPGRNYFAGVVLSPVLGFFPYASRLFPFGEYNKLDNLVNMGFEGGYLPGNLTAPLGWTSDQTGTLIDGRAWAGGMCWSVSGNGAGARGTISQSFYQDRFGIAIGKPNTSYSVLFWAQTTLNTAGFLIFDITSASAAFTSSGNVTVASIVRPGGAGAYYVINLSTPLPATIPSDLIFRYRTNNLPIGNTVNVDEIFAFPTAVPFRASLARGSYLNAPEQFDGVTGNIGPTDDDSPIRAFAEIRGTLYIDTANGKHSTSDNGTGEPSTWSVNEVTQSAGVFGVHASDPGRTGSGDSGEQWEFFAGGGGLYIFAGGETLKVSQEIQGLWDRINLAKQHLVWVKNDYVNRRCYVGVPLDTSTFPNKLLILDYNNLNDAGSIASTGPIRESMGGKLTCREFSRKWTPWNLATPCAELLTRPGNVIQMCFGAGPGGVAGASFGNFYSLDPAKLTDDDYGTIVPYYTIYLFGTDEEKQQFQLGRRLLATYLSMDIQGTGRAAITPYANILSNTFPALPAYPLDPNQNHDLEWDMAVDGERIGLRIGSVPGNGTFNVKLAQCMNFSAGVATAEFFLTDPIGLATGQTFVFFSSILPEFNGTWTVTVRNSAYDLVATATLAANIGDAINGGAITVSGLTDNGFRLQSLALTLKNHPWSAVRGAF